jgi:ATP phosphoribosyltransferase
MITVALSKGRILGEALPLLNAVGIAPSEDPDKTRRLVVPSLRQDVQLLLVRASDVPTYVRYGGADLGLVGSDVLQEQGLEGLYQPVDLGIGRCRLSLAAAKNFDASRQLVAGSRLRVATKYTRLARDYFSSQGIHADLIKLYGSMELAPIMGLADVIVDLVSTGATLAANGLVEIAPIADVSSRLVVNQASLKLHQATIVPLIQAFEAATLST